MERKIKQDKENFGQLWFQFQVQFIERIHLISLRIIPSEIGRNHLRWF